MPPKRITNGNNFVPISFKQPDKKKIEDEERRERLRKVLEKRRAKSTDPKDIPSNNVAENGNEDTENSK